MTEDEAKTKICCGPPAVLAAILTARGATPSDGVDFDACVGSACMAWRETKAAKSEHTITRTVKTTLPRVQIRAPDASGWVEIGSGTSAPDIPGTPRVRWVDFTKIVPAERAEGYCGLAGAPS